MPSSELFRTVAEITVNSLQWSSLATLVAGCPAIFVAWVLARREFWGKSAISSLINLPLVLPPTAVGFILLDLLAIDGLLGREFLGIDLGILLTPRAVVLACAIMSFPLIVRTARVAFEAIDPGLEDIAVSLGYRPVRGFFQITLPLAHRGLFAALILGFTRCLGEFGASVIVAGNIPGLTQTLASAIYGAQQTGDEGLARALMVVAVLLGFAAVYLTERLTRKQGGLR